MLWNIILNLIACKKYFFHSFADYKGKNNILFSNEFGINYIGWNLPKYLLKNSKYNLFVLGGVYSQKDIRLNETIRIDFACLLKKVVKFTQPKWKVDDKNDPEKETQIFYFQNVNFMDLIKDQIEKIYSKTYPGVIIEIDYFLKTLKEHSIKLVISSDDTTRTSKTLVIAAKSINIPTLVV